MNKEKKIEGNSSILVNKDNIVELSFLVEAMETYIEEGGEILIPKIISVNDFKGKFVEAQKKSFGFVLESEEEHENFFKGKDSIFLSFVIKPKNEK